MNTVWAQTKTEKGLMTLNLISLATCFVLFILLPYFTLVGGARIVVYIASIVYALLNIVYYVLPQNYKLIILKKRMLYVYLPSLVIIGVIIYDIFAVFRLDAFAILRLVFFIANGC